ncbi:GntR family transcriptional regulator [Anaerosacchariphilus polymeriproducens]|uniref:GntR family transcriptional regulator n=1 Tax=Anaerosacchariphilus polymeriproducens TaxID=1812858 RepID=A0A371AZ42_9FIRM|nr:GntR family transcriptional regulator [Anaerosacchariphilus polymeriproducens]
MQINYRDSRPIYEQVKEELRKLIITRSIKENEKLPSVREFASSLAINPNTIQRAYRELEAEGYIYTIAGKGTFAAPKADFSIHFHTDLMKQFEQVTLKLLYLGEKKVNLIHKINELSERSEQHDTGE